MILERERNGEAYLIGYRVIHTVISMYLQRGVIEERGRQSEKDEYLILYFRGLSVL